VRAAVDVMGGDKAPAAILDGCWAAAPLLGPEDSVLLIGDEAIIRHGLSSSRLSEEQKQRYKVVATTQVVQMDDPPVEAIRNKPDSSISVMCKLAAKGEADVVISAGNTGASVLAETGLPVLPKPVSRDALLAAVAGVTEKMAAR